MILWELKRASLGRVKLAFCIRQQHDYREDAIILQKPKIFEVEEFPYDTANNELFSWNEIRKTLIVNLKRDQKKKNEKSIRLIFALYNFSKEIGKEIYGGGFFPGWIVMKAIFKFYEKYKF